MSTVMGAGEKKRPGNFLVLIKKLKKKKLFVPFLFISGNFQRRQSDFAFCYFNFRN